MLLSAGLGAAAGAQSCTGLCQQQVSCPGDETTSITGTVYAPNGTDPLPNVTVYIPNAPVAPFTAGVSCPIAGAPPSGSPLVGGVTDVNGNFELDNVPVGTNIPLVIISGRWRRQLTVPATAACTNTALAPAAAVMPRNHTEGDIPKIAVATGAVDQVECVLRKVGIQDSEFTDPTGSGRINFFAGSARSGAVIGPSTPSQDQLMESSALLNSYDVLMLPCQGTPDGNVVSGALGTQELQNFVNFANSGGRIYSSHYSYAWMVNNPPFDSVVNWVPNGGSYADGTATVNTGFTAGQTLAKWLQNVGASSTPGQIAINTLRHDLNGVNSPTQSWLTLDVTGNPVMQFVFDTPIAPAGSGVNQCGRVLYNEYHVENGASTTADAFPSECSSTPMTPQEKLLEYMLFELTDDGGQPSLDPVAQDFGSQAVSFTSPPLTFTWKNNSSFAIRVKSATITGDFSISSNTCSDVAPATTCQIAVTFTPTALGARTGTLTIVAPGSTLTASLTGTGTPGFSLAPASLAFGSLDVGASARQTLTLTSLASGPLPVPPFTTIGEYAVSTSACGSTVAAGASCPVTVNFQPTTTGQQDGSVGVNSTSLLYNGLNASLSGNGVDFTIALSPVAGSVVAGDGASTTATLTPLAGFAAPLTLSCSVGGAVAANCGLSATTLTPAGPASVTVSLATTSQYTVVGYGVTQGRLWLIVFASGWLVWVSRRRTGIAVRRGLMFLIFGLAGVAASAYLSGCSGKLPTQNSAYTGPGTYTITVSATDGFLVHSATYKLTVTAR
ncbi:MAG TPA: choice-of-anchor D domain-containing protein [Acidobacteriaceae bacterium]|nr:choice-of-anchor D domain-containing protein [Acidobacteriaceae bacterium]